MSAGAARAARPASIALPAALAGGGALIALGEVAPAAAIGVVGMLCACAILAAAHHVLLDWRVLVCGLVAVVLFIPIRRYSLPANLPFQLEPYRLAVVFLAAAWLGSLLVDPATRWRRTGLEGPFLALAAAVALSIAANVQRIDALGLRTDVIKALTFLGSFLLVTVVVAGVVHRGSHRDAVLRVLVAGGAILGALAVVEARTGYNPFNSLPLLHFHGNEIPGTDARGHVRAYGSAQHAIALGALLAMLVPLGGYLALRPRGGKWWVAVVLLAIGAMATVSRTAVFMLAVEALVLLALKPRCWRALCALIVPFVVAVQIGMPGTLSAMKDAFFPKGGLVAQQKIGAGTYGSGRIADLSPSLGELQRRPLAGEGFGTRITERTDPKVNAPILDDQWLGFSLETGVLGLLALLWLFGRSVGRLGRLARRDGGLVGWRAAALAAAICGFAAGMITFDAFEFIQVTIVLYLLLGLAAADVRPASA
jgi:hypothetical protein